MSQFYIDLGITSKSLLEEFGGDWTYTAVTEGAFNPSTNVAAADTVTDTSIKAVKLDFDNHLIDGTTIKRGDAKLIVDNTITPTESDRVTDASGAVWNVLSVMTIDPGGVEVYHELHIRK